MIFLCATTARNAPCSEGCEEKNLLTILGSPHARGNSARLLAACGQALPAAVWRETAVSAFALNPIPCDDCGYCRLADGCSKPDLKAFYAALESADALIVATPVYNRSFPAPLKALLDRTQRYWSARFVRGVRPPVGRPKRAVLLVSSDSGGEEDARLLEHQLLPTLTILNAKLVGSVYAGNGEDDACLQKARDVGERLG